MFIEAQLRTLQVSAVQLLSTFWPTCSATTCCRASCRFSTSCCPPRTQQTAPAGSRRGSGASRESSRWAQSPRAATQAWRHTCRSSCLSSWPASTTASRSCAPSPAGPSRATRATSSLSSTSSISSRSYRRCAARLLSSTAPVMQVV